MTEPASSSSVGIVAVAVALLGPSAGQYAVIVLSALAGSLWALGKLSTPDRRTGAMLLLRLMLTAIMLTSSAAWWLEQQYKIPAHQMLAPLAFGIGALGDRWGPMIDMIGKRLARLLGGAQ